MDLQCFDIIFVAEFMVSVVATNASKSFKRSKGVKLNGTLE
jgi:hypothetical protein